MLSILDNTYLPTPTGRPALKSVSFLFLFCLFFVCFFTKPNAEKLNSKSDQSIVKAMCHLCLVGRVAVVYQGFHSF